MKSRKAALEELGSEGDCKKTSMTVCGHVEIQTMKMCKLNRHGLLLLLLLWQLYEWCGSYKPGMSRESRRRRQGRRQLRCQHCVYDVLPTVPRRRWHMRPSQPSPATFDDLSPDIAAADTQFHQHLQTWEHQDGDVLDTVRANKEQISKTWTECPNMAKEQVRTRRPGAWHSRYDYRRYLYNMKRSKMCPTTVTIKIN